MKPDILVVGASAGGVDALKQLITCLPKTFNGYIFIVLHIPAYAPSMLPQILSRCNIFEAVHPVDGDKMERRKIYIAPPDHHLLVEKDIILVRKGPKENRFRPSIDALFRSVAYSYGRRVMGIVLSGVLDDGTSGMWTIKRLGGMTIVQDYLDALHPQMPMNVQQFVEVDFCVPIDEMCQIIATNTIKEINKKSRLLKTDMELMKIEINIAKQGNAFSMGIMNKGTLTPFTCPECHGALVQFKEGKIIRFRCHTGHAYTASALLAGITKTIEEYLWISMRAVEECAMLLSKLKDDFVRAGNLHAASVFGKVEKEHIQRARIMHDLVFAQNVLSTDMQFEKGTNGDVDLPKKKKNK